MKPYHSAFLFNTLVNYLVRPVEEEDIVLIPNTDLLFQCEELLNSLEVLEWLEHERERVYKLIEEKAKIKER